MSGKEEHVELDYEREGKKKPGARVRAFEGQSNRRYTSTANDLHLAIQRAALAASKSQKNEEEWYELTRIRVLVSKNPNVKVYGATLSPSSGP